MSAKLPKDGTWILAYCGCPHAASGRVMDTLRAQGFPRTAVIDEGIFEWIRRGYPITYGKAPTVGAPP
jgi:cytochrome c oxidase cbb3-type subunit 3